jgi:hypothetical protein
LPLVYNQTIDGYDLRERSDSPERLRATIDGAMDGHDPDIVINGQRLMTSH